MMKMCVDDEIRLSYQGISGAFSEQAALQFFGDKIITVPCATFKDIFKNVELQRTEYGIIPVENSSIGVISNNYDLMSKYKIRVVDKIKFPIIHCLIASKRAIFNNITKVYSHPAALAQCSVFLRKNQDLRPISYYDTAGSVKMLKEKNLLDSAAIASKLAAVRYDMHIYKEFIQDKKDNATLFYVLEKAAK
jgi:prephenate dehydratase